MSSRDRGRAWPRGLQAALRYVAMAVLALALFAVILLLAGKDPIQAYRDIFTSTLGSAYGLSEVFVTMTPLLLTALAVALPSRLGLINVGGEGQLYLGALFATWGALRFSALPAWLLLPLMIVLGMIGGGLWALPAGYLRARGIVNETITTLLLNVVAPSIVAYFVFGFWHSPMDTNKTANFAAAARLPTLGGTRINLSLIFGVVLLALFWYVMARTRWGLEMRAIGGNPGAARRSGIPVARYLVGVMMAAGALAGLAGMAQVSGYYGVLLVNFSRGLGYMGFLVSWLAGGTPLGIVVTSFVVAVILTGGNLLQLTGDVPYAVINILLATTLFVVLARPSLPRRRKVA
ncbi:MAG TPA: ABC transporter permease [Anaerolineales bacterium]|nr:ABC transporter permease [Anaerolineales bacterium]